MANNDKYGLLGLINALGGMMPTPQDQQNNLLIAGTKRSNMPHLDIRGREIIPGAPQYDAFGDPMGPGGRLISSNELAAGWKPDMNQTPPSLPKTSIQPQVNDGGPVGSWINLMGNLGAPNGLMQGAQRGGNLLGGLMSLFSNRR